MRLNFVSYKVSFRFSYVLRFWPILGAITIAILGQNIFCCHSDDRREEESRKHSLCVIEILR